MNVSCSEDFIRQISFSFGLFELISSNPKLSCWHVAWSSYPFGLSSVGESTTSEAAKNFKRADPPAYHLERKAVREASKIKRGSWQERCHDYDYFLFIPCMTAALMNEI